MQAYDSKVRSQTLLKAFQFMQKKELDQAEALLQKGIEEAENSKDDILLGLFYSAYGVFFKIKKDFRAAWKYYEKAEKLIPQDPALKIISARLLVDYFGQYDVAIRKMNKVLNLPHIDFDYAHAAYTIQGLAYLKSGDKKKAVECLQKSMGNQFKDIQTSVNLDFALVHEMFKKKVGEHECRQFLEQAYQVAKSKKEIENEKMIKKMIDLIPK